MTVDLNLATILSLLTAMGLVYNIMSARRREAMAQGAKDNKINELETKIVSACDRVRTLENADRRTSEGLVEMRSELKHILAAVERIEKKLDEHIVSHVDGAGE